jgi:PhzF family phenazine biosynthesis protein
MGQRIVQVDAFTNRPFAGNPAAICVLDAPRDPAWMQRVAQEMNVAETAFLIARPDGYDLRWFTPALEVDLCGHATLACAHLLWEEGYLEPHATARFHTRSGLLTAERQGEWIEMDFPAEPDSPVTADPKLAVALGATPRYVGRNRFDLIVAVTSETVLRGLAPDFMLLGQIDARGVIVTSPSDHAEYDFVSRFFAPAAGILEDPVTGSAHCCLGPFWASRLGKTEFTGYQASARGGVVRVRVAGNRVYLGGQAVTTLRGELTDRATSDN